MIGAALVGGVGAALNNSMKAAKNIALGGELDIIRSTIADQIDCQATFGGLEPMDSTLCNSDSTVTVLGTGQDNARRYLQLKRKSVDGSIQLLTSAIDNNGLGRLGNWQLRTTCSASEHSLVIRAARINGNGEYLANPLTKIEDNFLAPKSLLYGGASGAFPICYGQQRLPASTRPPLRTANFQLKFEINNISNGNSALVDLSGSVPKLILPCSADNFASPECAAYQRIPQAEVAQVGCSSLELSKNQCTTPSASLTISRSQSEAFDSTKPMIILPTLSQASLHSPYYNLSFLPRIRAQQVGRAVRIYLDTPDTDLDADSRIQILVNVLQDPSS